MRGAEPVTSADAEGVIPAVKRAFAAVHSPRAPRRRNGMKRMVLMALVFVVSGSASGQKDREIITPGTCPYLSRWTGRPDGTAELIDAMRATG